MELEWDAKKRLANKAKHGVDFADADYVLSDPNALTIPDDRHDEERFVTIGAGPTGRLLVVVHTDRGDKVRVISARKANDREQAKYRGET